MSVDAHMEEEHTRDMTSINNSDSDGMPLAKSSAVYMCSVFENK